MQEGGPEPSAECSELVEAVRETVPVFLKALREKDIQTLKLILKWTGFNHILNVISRRYKRTGTCGVGRNTIAVSCRGTFYPCHRFVAHKDYALGNVFTGQLNRGVYLEPPLLTSQQCLNCWARHFCNGGCIGDHLVKTGHRFQPSQDFCQMTKSLLETGIHLASQLSQEEKEFLYDKGLIQRPFCPLDL